MRHLENDELNNLGVELVSRPSVVFQLLIESSHGSKLQDDRERDSRKKTSSEKDRVRVGRKRDEECWENTEGGRE